MKKSFIVLGCVAGIIGGVLMLLFIELVDTKLISPKPSNLLGLAILVLVIVAPQYFFYQSHQKVIFFRLFLTGVIAISIMILTMMTLGHLADRFISVNPSKAAKIIGVGSVISLIVALFMKFLNKRTKRTSEYLDDLDY